MKTIKDIFGLFSPKPVEQGGFIISYPNGFDRVYSPPEGARLSSVPAVDWKKFLPRGEAQSVAFRFDTLSCTTFSALNCVETQMKNMEIPQEHLQFLIDNGYVKDGEVDFSDKFTAIMSGTTMQGNTFQNVGNSMRHDGLIPNAMLPFGNEGNWQDWHDRSQITPEMVALGREFVRHFDISYEFVYAGDSATVPGNAVETLRSALATAPLQAAMPYPASHAVMALEVSHDTFKYFDTYGPFVKSCSLYGNLHVALRVVITPRNETIKSPLIRALRQGCRGADVMDIQKALNRKTGSSIRADGVFGQDTKNLVMRFQKDNMLKADGIVGTKTYNMLYPKKEQKNVVIIKRRFKEATQTRGELSAYNTEGRSFFCKTIEPPWKNNQVGESCIPAGTYEVFQTYSPSFKKNTYEVRSVSGRTGIRIHVANYARLLQGCIALGRDFSDLDADGTLDVSDSTITLNAFETFFSKKAFTLIIED